MTRILKVDNNGMGMFDSERCYIRPFCNNDIDDFMVYRNNLEWMQYQGFKGFTREKYEEVLLKEQVLEEGAQFAIIRKSDQHLIGDVYVMKEDDEFWVGYTINPLYKRQGYTYEIVNAMITWIKEQGDFNIMAGVEPENLPSIRLLEKIGFVKVKVDNGEIIYSLR